MLESRALEGFALTLTIDDAVLAKADGIAESVGLITSA
jgi:hypothetical protein